MLQTITKHLKRFKHAKRGLSNVIVVMLSLVILVVISANVILWSYQMNQLDWEKMKEDISIADIERINRSSWFVAQSEYTVNDGSYISGSYTDTQAVDSRYERFTEALATPIYYPNGYSVSYGTYLSGTVPGSVQTVDSDYFIVRSAGTASSTTAYNPLGYSLLGSTTLVSGTTGDLVSNNGVYMTFRSYSNYDFRYAESLVQSSTTSTTYQDKVTLTFTPPTAGDYIIIADAEVAGSSTFYNAKACLNVAGTVYQELIYRVKATTNWYPFNALKRLTLSSQITIKIQYSSSNTAATAYIRNARLIVFKLPSEYTESEARTTTTSTSWQSKVTLTFTPASAGDYLIIATANLDGSSTSYDVKCQLIQDGSTVHASVVRRTTNSAARYNFGVMRKVTLTAESHTFDLQYCSSSTSGTAGIGYAHTIAIRLDQFPKSYYNESETESTTASANTWYDKVTLPYTPNAGDHLIFGSLHHTSASTSATVSTSLNQNGNTATTRVITQQATTDYESSFSFTKAYLDATSKTDKIQYMCSSTTAKVKMARILSLQLFEQIVEVEFTRDSNTQPWSQLVWTVDGSFTTDSVKITLQLWNYQTGQYPTGGDGYMQDTIGTTDVTKTQNITINPTNFQDGSGIWKMKVKGVKISPAQFDFRADWIEFKTTYYNQYTVSTELTFSNMPTTVPGQLNFTIVSEYNIASVSVTIQVWNYSSSAYVNSGEGYLTYMSSGSNETRLLSINTNPQFYTSNGNAKIKVTGVKSTTSQYLQKINQIKLYYKIENRLDINGGYVIDLSTYPLAHIQTVEIQLRYKASDNGEKWYLKAYNWTRAAYSDFGFNSTTGHTPTTGWDYYVVNLTTSWRSYVWNNGTIYVQFSDQTQDNTSTTIDIDFLGVRAVSYGARFSFKNEGPLTSHLISLWVNNATNHRRYDINLFVNSGENVAYVRLDISLSMENFVVKVVTEKGNVAVFAEH